MNTTPHDDLLPGLVHVVDHLSRDALKVYLSLRCGLGVDRTTHCTVDEVISLFDVNGAERTNDALMELLGKGLLVTVAHDEKSGSPATTFRMAELRHPLLPPPPMVCPC